MNENKKLLRKSWSSLKMKTWIVDYPVDSEAKANNKFNLFKTHSVMGKL